MAPGAPSIRVALIALAACCVAGSGCVAAPARRPPPPEQRAAVAGQIENGRSTPDDVFALLGEPSSRTTDANGLEQWVYWSTEEVGGRYAHTRIVVEFGPDGTVQRVASSRVAP